MSKYWKYGSRDDSLAYYVMAPNREMATKVVEDLVGPQNPSRRLVTELPGCPDGYWADDSLELQLLNEEE